MWEYKVLDVYQEDLQRTLNNYPDWDLVTIIHKSQLERMLVVLRRQKGSI